MPPVLERELVTRSGGKSPGVCVNVIVVLTSLAAQTVEPEEKERETSRTVLIASSASSTSAVVASWEMASVVSPLRSGG